VLSDRIGTYYSKGGRERAGRGGRRGRGLNAIDPLSIKYTSGGGG